MVKKKTVGKKINNYETFTRANRRKTTITNAGIKRNRVLSSGRPLPSARGLLKLKGMVEEAHSLLRMVEERYKKRADILVKKNTLHEKYRRQPERALEDPKTWLLDQQFKAICAEYKEAEELYECLQGAYKRTTGQRWKPKADINAPLDIEF